MDKAELNAKLGYNRELLNQLSNAFDLQEDYNDYGWDKLFEICRYIYNLEQQCKKQKEINQKAIEYIKEKQKIQYKFALSQIECDDLLQILEDKEVSE